MPSAQSNMLCKGRRARWMEVVQSHTGSPRRITTAQNDVMTRTRMRMLSEPSKGGVFRDFVVETNLESWPSLLLFGSSSMVKQPHRVQQMSSGTWQNNAWKALKYLSPAYLPSSTPKLIALISFYGGMSRDPESVEKEYCTATSTPTVVLMSIT